MAPFKHSVALYFADPIKTVSIKYFDSKSNPRHPFVWQCQDTISFFYSNDNKNANKNVFITVIILPHCLFQDGIIEKRRKWQNQADQNFMLNLASIKKPAKGAKPTNLAVAHSLIFYERRKRFIYFLVILSSKKICKWSSLEQKNI